jgi:UDP-N-acetyl-D-glucosamine dehydrogenase
VRDAQILALGVTYKPNVGDVRESAAILVLEQLARRGARITFHDPFVRRVDRHGLRLRRTALSDTALRSADCVVVLTPHDSYDLDHVVRTASFVFDARHATASTSRGNVVTL